MPKGPMKRPTKKHLLELLFQLSQILDAKEAPELLEEVNRVLELYSK